MLIPFCLTVKWDVYPVQRLEKVMVKIIPIYGETMLKPESYLSHLYSHCYDHLKCPPWKKSACKLKMEIQRKMNILTKVSRSDHQIIFEVATQVSHYLYISRLCFWHWYIDEIVLNKDYRPMFGVKWTWSTSNMRKLKYVSAANSVTQTTSFSVFFPTPLA